MASNKDSHPNFTEQVINIPFRQPLAMDNEVSVKSLSDMVDPTGIEGTLVIPKQYTARQLSQDPTLVRPQRRVVIVAHGQSGHRNYIYQKLLSHSLATKNGLHVFRFDFRNCGNSQNVDTSNGLNTDAENTDLTVVANYLKIELGLLPAALVGHSRGSNACMMWTLGQQLKGSEGIFIPSLINCSGRFRTELIFQWYKENEPDLDFYSTRYIPVKARRFVDRKDTAGKPIEVVPYISRHEPISIASYDMDQIKYLRKDTQVLTIHGDKDDIINVKDAYLFDKALKGHHDLKIIKNSNHNYVSSDRSVIGGGGFEKNARSLVPELVEIITKYLSVDEENKRFQKQAEVIASTHVKTSEGNYIQLPRWQKQIKNVINFRDFGGYPVAEKKGIKRLWVKPGILYRCGKLDFADDNDKQAIADLGIKQVFDLRSNTELYPNKMGNSTGLFEGLPGSGIKTTHTPLFSEKEYNPEALARRFAAYAGNGFDKTYTEILTAGGLSGSFKLIFEWIRDHPGVPFLIHCSAGKDRTGILAMLILLLLSVEKDTIAHEYQLTTLGYASERNRILEAAKTGFFEERSEKQFQGMTVGGWANLLSSRYETMIETLALLENKFGGVYHYLENVVGLSHQDLMQIKTSLLYEGDRVEVQRTFYPSKI